MTNNARYPNPDSKHADSRPRHRRVSKNKRAPAANRAFRADSPSHPKIPDRQPTPSKGLAIPPQRAGKAGTTSCHFPDRTCPSISYFKTISLDSFSNTTQNTQNNQPRPLDAKQKRINGSSRPTPKHDHNSRPPLPFPSASGFSPIGTKCTNQPTNQPDQTKPSPNRA